MSSKATILQIDALLLTHPATLDFTKPIDKGIRILTPKVQGDEQTYFGDEVSLLFWSLLKLPIGLTPDPSNPLTRQDGYRYVYNHITKVFDAYDAGGNNFVHIPNIVDIAQMNIDFTIMNSHQFEIIVNPNDIMPKPFIFPTRWYREPFNALDQSLFECGLQNTYLPNYEGENITFNIKHLSDLVWIGIQKYMKVVEYNPRWVDIYSLEGLNYFWDIRWDKTYPTNYFYWDGFNTEAAVLLPETKRVTHLPYFIQIPISMSTLTPVFLMKNTQTGKLKLTSPLLLQSGNNNVPTNLYPDLLPVQRTGETQNNRPVYEPWLIIWFPWVYSIHTKDRGPFEIPVFDLSPRFS